MDMKEMSDNNQSNALENIELSTRPIKVEDLSQNEENNPDGKSQSDQSDNDQSKVLENIELLTCKIKVEDLSQNEENNSDGKSYHQKKRKKIVLKKGIIYVSTIPPFMNVTKITEIMSQYGDVGRVFLQPAKLKKSGKKPAKHFTEGWIEFLSKRVAKEVAANLNNTMIGGRKKSRYYDYMWNLKYLPRFKWVHLNERLEYERAVLKQKLRAEIEQAKRESSHFAHTVELSEKKKKHSINTSTKDKETELNHIGIGAYKQRKTADEIRNQRKEVKNSDRTTFLKNLFVTR